jgi:hypothetical protein
MKSVLAHGAVLVVAAGLAIGIWTKDETKPSTQAASQVEVWGGDHESIELISFEAPARKVRLEPKKDEHGRYFVATVDKETIKGKPAGHHHGSDAGDDEPGEKVRETQRFIGVKNAEELAKKLAPLLAVRTVGKIEGGRSEEFGLDKPDGTLKVKVAGREHALLIGSASGGQERYAKLLSTGVVYAVPADVAQSMLSAEAKLLERDLHGFADADVTRVKISKAGKSREGLRLPEKKDGWADAAAPGKLDETLGNYMTKVGRLRVIEYVEKPAAPVKPEDAVVRVDYYAGNKALGFIEVYEQPGEKGKEFIARTEYGRWYVEVLASAAEQLGQDLSGILK